jgi:hypothetical protein
MGDTIIKMRCKAFASDKAALMHRLQVSDDGHIRVWDSVAGHFTLCHDLGVAAQKRALKKAKISEELTGGIR